MSGCIFCKIIEGKVPANIVYEDEMVVAFWDANPASPIHILIVPRKHIPTLNDVPDGDAILGHIGDVAKKVQYGLSKRGLSKGKYRILRMNNLTDGRLDPSAIQYVDLNEGDFDKFRLHHGDILFNRTNSHDLVGKTSLFDLEGEYVFASYLIRVALHETKIMPGFLNWYLNLDSNKARLKQLATRAVSQSNINATKLKGFEIPLPTLMDQQEIVRKINLSTRKIAAESVRLAACNTLFETMLHHLMTGQIRVQDLDPPLFRTEAPDEAGGIFKR